jgi:hypothetical protein
MTDVSDDRQRSWLGRSAGRGGRVRQAALVVGVAALAVTAAVALSPSGGRVVEADEGGIEGAGGEFHALPPARIFDSREPAPLDVAPFGKKPTDQASSPQDFHVPLLGRGDIPTENVLAVAATVTIVSPTLKGHLRAYPKGGTPTETSIANFKVGQTVANSVILRPGADGAVAFRPVTSGPGRVHVVIDISGWWSTSGYETRGARLETVEPVRVYDSRDTSNLMGPETATVPIRGVGPVPDSEDVVGVIVNLTGDNTFPGSAKTRFSVVPEPFDASDEDEWPGTSNLNLAAGQRRANTVITPIGEDGSIRVFSPYGEIRAIVDITGYLQVREEDTGRAGRVIPLVSPFRALNTRLPEFYDQPLGPASAEPWSFDAFVNDVSVSGVPVGAQQGLLGNLTAVDLSRQYSWVPVSSFLAVYPAGPSGDDECTPVPNISNVNFVEIDAVPNMALLRYGGDTETPHRICVFNRGGYVDYILDVYAIVLDDET